MLLRLLHACGLTNLSDGEIHRASALPDLVPPFKAVAFVATQALIITAVIFTKGPTPEPPVLLAVNNNTLNIPRGAVLTVPETVVLRAPLNNAEHGQPVVLVKPLFAGQPWYVQHTITSTTANTFESVVHFGDRHTIQGTHFLLAIALVDTNAASAFRPGAQVSDSEIKTATFQDIRELPSTDTPLLVARK
jgi:hypothetical protein